MEKPKREYQKGKVIVTWNPNACTHSGICARGLPNVFKPKEKPWIQTEGASEEEIVNQVKQCPSGALGYHMAE